MEVKRIHFETITSTQDFAKQHAREFDPKQMTCITADVQTAGRGRKKGRKWVSKKGNLHMTLFFVAPLDPNLAQILTFSVAKVLEIIDVACQIKWPNDLLYDGKKICGCMVEKIPDGLVMGIGLNVNTPVATDQPTISLYDITNKKWALDPIVREITEEFTKNWRRGFAALQKELEKMIAYKGEWIQVSIGQKIVEGICQGISEKGHLQIQKKNGKLVQLLSGEIQQIRKI